MQKQVFYWDSSTTAPTVALTGVLLLPLQLAHERSARASTEGAQMPMHLQNSPLVNLRC
jgi:hypothetical protein